ncbi:MAG: 30S ribosomal protein S5, partial [Candidatus Falkowbacteria bacterium]|nr:30S ribosomal protein S5 [Candidatus Falkowbacteria bacterium]
MAEDKKQASPDTNTQAAATVATDIYGAGNKKRSGGGKPYRKNDRGRDANRDEFEQRILDVARVTRVMAGGKRMSFRACVAIGDRKGKIAVGVGKGADVTMAVNKAVNRAKKEMILVPTINDTIPHVVFESQG